MSTAPVKKTKSDTFPITIKGAPGISAKIYKTTKKGTDYVTFMVSYTLLGSRKMKGFADLEEAKAHAQDACEKISAGQQAALQLNNEDSATYLRAKAHLPEGVALDGAARDYAEVIQILAGRASAVEAAREWVKRNAAELPKITVSAAVEKLKAQLKADGKSQGRQQQIAAALAPFAQSFNCEVHTLAPSLISTYLTDLPHVEKTKKNHRDALGYFFRWLVLRGFLAKGTNLLEGVQEYSGRKFGKIITYTPEEMAKLLIGAQKSDQRMIPSLALGAFAQLRTAEISRIDWNALDFDDDGRNSKAEPVVIVENDIAKNGDEGEADRTVPMKANLIAWLAPFRKSSGKVCPFTEKQISKHWQKIAEAAGVPWKKNALRHSCISARIGECRDVARVADESGNSPTVIRKNYRKVAFKERDAVVWFSITPENVAKVADGEALPVVEKIVPMKKAA
jgi:integrase